jgi:hypothetical protein
MLMTTVGIGGLPVYGAFLPAMVVVVLVVVVMNIRRNR